MKLITQNFRLNALANQYAAALYHHVKLVNGGDWFTVQAEGETIQVNIIGGIAGMREIVDSYLLEALQQNYPRWEDIGCALLGRCVDGTTLTEHGSHIWESMINDIGTTVAKQGGRFNA